MPPAPDLRWRLRDATQEAHARLDAGATFDDAAGYAAFLLGMHGFLQAAAQAVPDATLQAAHDALRADLDVLGIAPPAAVPHGAVTVAQALGWRYVLAGATLGARVLEPRARALGFDAAHGGGYLAAQCRSTAWPAWLREAGAVPQPQHDDAVAGAHAAFAAAQAAMDQARCAA